ncbi:MAG: excinuclease ABC subunit UvrC [Candidatus Riflebacteria bacterium]|nr:excinuclease ABC subunit UvrC [Candidatus Riflebacteria bacterium]
MIEKEDLKLFLAHLPGKPGVYIMQDSNDQIIYVGKSKHLKKRVSSYFKVNKRNDKTSRLVFLIKKIDFIVTNNEIEALILENNLIKKHKPRFNVQLKDSKTHPYLVVTLKEDFPRILKVRKIFYGDGNRYFGPFPDESGLRFILEILGKSFKLCTCNSPIDSKKNRNRPCLKYSLGLCKGPCLGVITKEEYSNFVKGALGFLSGKRNPDTEAMKKRMAELSSHFRFEEAAEMRDTIFAIESFFTKQKVEMPKPFNNDFWGISESSDHLVASVFFVRGGKLLGNRVIHVERTSGNSSEEIFGDIFFQFYEKNLIPKTIFAAKKPKPFEAILSFLKSKSGKNVRIGNLKSGARKRLLDLAQENAVEVLRNIKSEEQPRVAEGIIELEKSLELKKTPWRIECIDISHLQGTDCVASLVVFFNGSPKKSEYRRFHIRDVSGIDDPASIREVLDRRLKRLLKEKSMLPDLIIVDGGAGQVSSAKKALDENGVDIPLFGLAKREEILHSVDHRQIKLPLASHSLKILVHLRDEAHRFANSFQSQTRSKRVIRSALLSLPGVGMKTIQKILSIFGSLQNVSKVSFQEFKEKTGIREKLAELIFNSIKTKSVS